MKNLPRYLIGWLAMIMGAVISHVFLGTKLPDILICLSHYTVGYVVAVWMHCGAER